MKEKIQEVLVGFESEKLGSMVPLREMMMPKRITSLGRMESKGSVSHILSLRGPSENVS